MATTAYEREICRDDSSIKPLPDQSCIERSCIPLKKRSGPRQLMKRSVDENHSFKTDCMNIELFLLVNFCG